MRIIVKNKKIEEVDFELLKSLKLKPASKSIKVITINKNNTKTKEIKKLKINKRFIVK
jgi:ethanolamine utilization microcompartment shell protein EutL